MERNLDFYAKNDNDIRLVVSSLSSNSGCDTGEFYYHDNILYFAYLTADNNRLPRQENRYYFKDGKMIRWLVGKKEAEVSRNDASFKEEETRIWQMGGEIHSKYEMRRMGPRE